LIQYVTSFQWSLVHLDSLLSVVYTCSYTVTLPPQHSPLQSQILINIRAFLGRPTVALFLWKEKLGGVGVRFGGSRWLGFGGDGGLGGRWFWVCP
jgi:hypothetical protein